MTSAAVILTRILRNCTITSITVTMTKAIFPPWDFSTWTDVDDRVRGGSSTSHLEPVHLDSDDQSDKPSGAKFWGHLGKSRVAISVFRLWSERTDDILSQCVEVTHC